MKIHKLHLILASMVILLPMPVKFFLTGKLTVTLITPVLLLGVFWLCIFFTLKDPNNQNQSQKPFLPVIWITPALSILVFAMDYCFSNDLDFDLERVFFLFFGLLFLIIGNYLPKIRRNYTYGFKLPWTYRSEENWNATHRLGGKIWFFAGTVQVISAFLPGEVGIWVLLAVTAVAILIPTVYSYLYYRKQKAAGTAMEPMPILPGSSAKTSLVFLAALGLFLYCVMFTGNIEYHFGETSLTVDPSYYDTLTVEYAHIQDVKYLNHNMEGRRVWGYGSLRLLLGTFEHEDTQYTRYTYYDPQSAVGLLLEDQIIVLSGKNPEETWVLYEILLEKCGLK